MSVGSLGYIGLKVKDPDAWAGYATGVLGLMPGEVTGRYRLDDMAWRIAVEAGEADDLSFMGFEVAGSAELEAVRGRLAEGGVAVGNGDPALLAERGVLGLITCQDPDGLQVEVFYGPTLRTETPFASPAGVTGFVTGEQGLGHVVLSTRDMAAARHFYQDLLGFRLSDIIHMQPSPQFGFDMEFFHCNARHHTLARRLRLRANGRRVVKESFASPMTHRKRYKDGRCNSIGARTSQVRGMARCNRMSAITTPSATSHGTARLRPERRQTLDVSSRRRLQALRRVV